MAMGIGVAMQMIGQGLEAYGEYSETKTAAAELEYEGYIARQDAELIGEAGELELHKAKTDRRKLLARQVAIAAASGRDISGGSPLAIIEASERALVLDEQVIAFNTQIAVGRKLGEAELLFGTGRSLKKAAKLGLYMSILGMAQTGAKSFGGGKGSNIKSRPKTKTPKVKTRHKGL